MRKYEVSVINRRQKEVSTICIEKKCQRYSTVKLHKLSERKNVSRTERKIKEEKEVSESARKCQKYVHVGWGRQNGRDQ